MTDIYEQHKAAFARVSAFVVLNAQGERVATVALKFPADGAGRLYAYLHVVGVEMVRAHAGGYGYDKRSAAVASAAAKVPAYGSGEHEDAESVYGRRINMARDAFRRAAPSMDSGDWIRAVEAQGLTVLQAV